MDIMLDLDLKYDIRELKALLEGLTGMAPAKSQSALVSGVVMNRWRSRNRNPSGREARRWSCRDSCALCRIREL